MTVKRSKTPNCKLCDKAATKFCRLRLDDGEGHERDLAEVDLCDEHYETWAPEKL